MLQPALGVVMSGARHYHLVETLCAQGNRVHRTFRAPVLDLDVMRNAPLRNPAQERGDSGRDFGACNVGQGRFHWLHQRDVPATGADKRCCQLHGRSISGRIRQRDKNIHLGCWTQRPALPRILRQSCTEILTWVKVLTITRYARRPQRTFRRSGWSRSTTEQRSAIRPLPRRSSISAMSWSRVRW